MQPRAYWWREGDEIVVQNFIGAYMGQEHRHTLAAFQAWKRDAEAGGWDVIELAATKDGTP
jgi:hypothetical protein